MVNILMVTTYRRDPPKKMPFDCETNCQKLDKKNCQKFKFCIKKNWHFFLKKCQVFGNFLTFKWQFSGGLGKDEHNIEQ